MSVTRRLFAEVMGGRAAADYIGSAGELFIDTTGTLRMSDGTTPGGSIINFYDNGMIRGVGDFIIISGNGGNDDISLVTDQNGGDINIGNQYTYGVNIGVSFADNITRIRSDKFSVLATVPTSSKGKEGDEPGMFAFNGSYAYFCVGAYAPPGNLDIWRKVALTGGAW